MYKKKHLVITAVLTALVCFIVFGMLFTKFTPYLLDPVVRAKNIIISDYVNELTPEQRAQLDDAAIDAMVEKLGDPYSRYMSADDFASYQEEISEDYVGIGMSVMFDVEQNVIVVMSPYDNSPAQRAGILPGDRITEVDGQIVSIDTYSDVVSYIKDAKKETGEKIHIKILRGEEDTPLEFDLAREEVDIQTISHKMYDDIGYIRISQFMNRTEEEFAAALSTLRDKGAKGLVIDLRNNPGGYAHTVISMCDMLLPEGTIAYLEDNEGNREYFKSDEEALGLPMVVLQNKGTASASELMSGSLQAYGLATIIGETSFGKAVGQTPYMLSSTTALYLTNARYFTPKGECIDKKGITPDIEIELSDEKLSRIDILSLEEDTQLAKALEVLREK